MKRLILITGTLLLIIATSLFTFNLTTMKTLETEIIIDTTPQKVWEVLMDHEEYPHWNPFIKQISGVSQTGQTLQVTIHPEGKEPMNFVPVVLKNEKEREFRWLGHLFIKGLFDGEHYFTLEIMGPNQTRLVHGEHFSGLMSGALLRMIGENTLRGFNDMNKALKEQAENI